MGYAICLIIGVLIGMVLMALLSVDNTDDDNDNDFRSGLV